MKKILVVLFLAGLTTSLFAQDQAKPATQSATPTTTPSKATTTHRVVIKNYCCPACDYTSQKPGSCPTHNKALIRDGMYYCEDGTSSREQGVCADGKSMVKMVDKSQKRGEIKVAPAAK